MLSKEWIRQSNAGGTAKWVAEVYQYVDQRVAKVDGVDERKKWEMIIELRYSVLIEGNEEILKTAVIERLSSVHGLQELTYTILTVEAGITYFIGKDNETVLNVIKEELSANGIPQYLI